MADRIFIVQKKQNQNKNKKSKTKQGNNKLPQVIPMS